MSREVCGICWCPYDEDTGACGCPPPSVQKSTLREAAVVALKVMQAAEVDPHSSDAVYKAITALKAALAKPDTCTWFQDGDSDSSMYQTSCRKYFDLTDGTPENNKMQWCCYCGKRLVQELITEDDDE